MGDAVNNIRSTIKQLTDAVDSSKGGWQGDASDACGKAATSWDDEASRLNSILDEITQMVGSGNKDYGHMDTGNVQHFTNLG